MLELDESIISGIVKDRLDKANDFKTDIDKSFLDAADAKKLTSKMDKQVLIKLNTFDFLHVIGSNISNEILLGNTECNIYFTDVKMRHLFVTFPLQDYDRLDWQYILSFLKLKGYDTSLETKSNEKHGPISLDYKIFTVSWK